MPGARITGWGTALPEKIVTNADLAATVDTSDEWIVERTGIRERRIGGTTCDLAVEAGREALDRAGVDPSAVDLLIVCTTTPDQTVPATSASVQRELGLGCGAMDINAACAGFVYGLVTAYGLMGTGLGTILLVGSETLSRITDWDDRATCILFGDGAGAVVLQATEDVGSLRGWDLGADGKAQHLLYADVGGFLRMDGREVFRRAVRVMVSSAEASMARAGVTRDEIALVVPHQANQRIIDSACQKLGFGAEKVASVLARTGNTSSASIPLALVDAVDAGRLSPGDLVLLVGFGAGMTWASAVIEWNP